MNGERQESALWRCFFFLPDIALSSVPSGADTALLLATEPLAGYLRHPAALARLSGDFLTQFFYYEGGGPAIMAVVLLLWGVVVFRLLVSTWDVGRGLYGVGGGLGGRKAMRIELSAFRHNRFNRYRRCFVVVS